MKSMKVLKLYTAKIFVDMYKEGCVVGILQWKTEARTHWRLEKWIGVIYTASEVSRK